jgi:N-dimethylarginine dimethylaminohydrolase
MLYRSVDDLDFYVTDLAEIDPPGKVLMTTPAFFQVRYVINPHMQGNIGSVDGDVAREQWDSLRGVYEAIGLEVSALEGVQGLPDMVFSANQALPYLTPSGEKGIFPSLMHAPERRGEVPHFTSFFTALNYRTRRLPRNIPDFEGMGDALWHPSRFLLYGGYGFRSDPAAYKFISDELDVPVVLLRLEDPDFYHLDTCLCVLDEHTCMIYAGAFDDEGLDLIDELFDTVIEAPEDEARRHFAVNAHCPDERHVVIPENCDITTELLSQEGFLPIEVDTSEFIKSGGSVFCMKQMYW